MTDDIFLSGSGGSHHLLRRGSSRVGFVPNQVKPPTDVPSDLTDQAYESLEDITTYTLQPSQLAVVISSYDKTIGKTIETITNEWQSEQRTGVRNRVHLKSYKLIKF